MIVKFSTGDKEYKFGGAVEPWGRLLGWSVRIILCRGKKAQVFPGMRPILVSKPLASKNSFYCKRVVVVRKCLGWNRAV